MTRYTITLELDYEMLDNHPDLRFAKGRKHTWKESAIYNPNSHGDLNDYLGRLALEVRLVAGGGYRTDTIREIEWRGTSEVYVAPTD